MVTEEVDIAQVSQESRNKKKVFNAKVEHKQMSSPDQILAESSSLKGFSATVNCTSVLHRMSLPQSPGL